MKNVLLVIPAIKKNAVIPGQLIKKLNNVTLIQRAINTALESTKRENIYIVTDSEEISLICERNNIAYFHNNLLSLNSNTILEDLQKILNKFIGIYKHMILYRANTPLVRSSDIDDAYTQFLLDPAKTIISVKQQDYKSIYSYDDKCLYLQDSERKLYKEVKAFKIISFNSFVMNDRCSIPYVLPHDKSIEIESYQDWWVCEKILQQKTIVFNVIGSLEIGMGHIYRALSLAHEITDHKVVFVCDEKYSVTVNKIVSTDYHVITSKNVTQTILNLKPDLLINDVLNTSLDYITKIKNIQIPIVNFEDLGDGGQIADLVFNELYDNVQPKGDHYFWGYQYMALRDEFYDATPHDFEDIITSALITFGGTDQNNLTLIALEAIIETCKEKNIKIYIVCGGGYLYKNELESYIDTQRYKNIEVTYASGVISKIMEKSQIAISSNGRTIYELADMNIPTIVVSHHEREETHTFASLEKGFINLGVSNQTNTKQKITSSFNKLTNDTDYRKLLFLNIKPYSFRENKHKIMKKIMELI